MEAGGGGAGERQTDRQTDRQRQTDINRATQRGTETHRERVAAKTVAPARLDQLGYV